MMAELITSFYMQEENAAMEASQCWERLEIYTEEIALLDWLVAQDAASKIYWEGRDGDFAMAGLGLAECLAATGATHLEQLFGRMRECLSADSGRQRFYGGCRFYESRPVESCWQVFGAYQFILPRWELYRENNATVFACNLRWEEDESPAAQAARLLNELHRLNFSLPGKPPVVPHPTRRLDLPNREAWTEMINEALQVMDATELRKVVLARKSVFAFEEDLHPLALMQLLRQSQSNLFYFYFQPEPGIAFLGGSPERLYRKENCMLKSEAIAGTRPRGRTPDLDRALEQELLGCEKDRREHRFVVDNISENFESLCHTVDIDDEITILKLAQVQHLRCRLQGVLLDGVTDAEILQVLHPTPAVGGSPTYRAIEVIKSLEPFDRGWYAAPIGWVSAAASEFVVGIRSGLVYHNELALFSGAGIVQGSTPDGEWAEIENKIANFMKALMPDEN